MLNEPRPIPVIAALPHLDKARAIAARIAALQVELTQALDRAEHELTHRLPSHFLREVERYRREVRTR